MQGDATLVLDIGKTNAKLALMDANGALLAERRTPNTVLAGPPYPHHDTERLWAWMMDTMAELAQLATIGAIVPVTHGATAALVGDDGELVLPVLDYEYAFPEDAPYSRPAFASTLSPQLPAGLNLGRQLAWLATTYPEQFARTRHILMYPQYWAWRLCGVAAGEATSLGCHTDLWNPATQRYSALVDDMGWNKLMPEVLPPWTRLGKVRAEVRELAGLPAHCQVVCGIHDSNASLLRYLGDGGARTVLSTGTWVIAAAFGAPLSRLDESRDMLANTNALGQPVACMRYMGGREFAALAGEQPALCGSASLAKLVAQGSMALPCFAETGGPFAGRAGSFEGPPAADAAERTALATLYCALMTDYCLDALGAEGPVTIEGSFTGNPWFARVLAALRPAQAVEVSADASGTTCGGWMLDRWGSVPEAQINLAAPLAIEGLQGYRDRWRTLLE
jgi:L-fuculokinase